MAISAVMPQQVEIINIDKNNKAKIRIRKDIIEKTTENDFTGEVNTIYEFKETEISLTYYNGIVENIQNNIDLYWNMDIDEIKQNKHEEIRALCNIEILAGFQSDAKGEVKHYDFTYEDQINMAGIQSRIFKEILLTGNATTPIEWKNSEQIKCDTDWTSQQFIKLCEDAEAFKTSKIKKYQVIVESIKNATTIEEVKAISWNMDVVI